MEDEVWLASAANAGAATIGARVLPLPRWEAHRGGDQETPGLAATALAPNGAIASVWEDEGATIGGVEARPDVVVEVVPVPVRRFAVIGGSQ